MLDKLKDNILLILLCVYLIFCAVIAVYNYKIQSDYWFEIENGYYEQCQIDNSDTILCNHYSEPVKRRDTLTTFGYIILTDNKVSFLQILAPLLIMIVAVNSFHKKLKKGYFKNSLTRIDYKKSFKKLYLDSLKYVFIMPIFLITIFVCSYFLSGNFDYEYSSRFYNYDVFGIENSRNL
ncbi:MAG TPA: hypothetical protein GX747_02200, partial [Tenericutes bacterium]|nr:hypothetical protein [Mycoplasmatota bacterium]